MRAGGEEEEKIFIYQMFSSWPELSQVLLDAKSECTHTLTLQSCVTAVSPRAKAICFPPEVFHQQHINKLLLPCRMQCSPE